MFSGFFVFQTTEIKQAINWLKMQSEKTLSEIIERTEEKIEFQLTQASERSIRELDQKSLQEIRDNKMLRREVETHRAESDKVCYLFFTSHSIYKLYILFWNIFLV